MFVICNLDVSNVFSCQKTQKKNVTEVKGEGEKEREKIVMVNPNLKKKKKKRAEILDQSS